MGALRLVSLFAISALPVTGLLPQGLEAPAHVMMDEIFIIRAHGLMPGSRAVLRAAMADSSGRAWIAEATFAADEKGQFSTRRAPVAGSYAGPHPMGLIWAMAPDGKPSAARYSPPDLTHVPLKVTLLVGEKPVDSLTIDRLFMSPQVRRVESDRDSGLVWSLFTPKMHAIGAAILVLGGSEGGNSSEDIAAALASHGYTAASLAYFNARGVVEELKEIPLEYFEKAISELISRGFARSGRIGILATSKGAEAALLVASIDKRVRAVVAYAPSSFAWSCICSDATRPSWTLHGDEVPFLKPGRDPSYQPGAAMRPAVNYRYRMLTARNTLDATIRVDRYRGRLMLIAGEDDQLWHSAEMARQIQAQRSAGIYGRYDRYLLYPGAGHFIGKLFLPSGSTLIAGGRIDTGGSPTANALAQEDSWNKVLEFFRAAFSSR